MAVFEEVFVVVGQGQRLEAGRRLGGKQLRLAEDFGFEDLQDDVTVALVLHLLIRTEVKDYPLLDRTPGS